MNNENKNLARYRLYREHKYIFSVFTKLLQLLATLDWAGRETVNKIATELNRLNLLLRAHAEYEEARIHLILKNKGSLLFQKAARQHHEQENCFATLTEKIQAIVNSTEIASKNFLGYELYLEVRKFFSENLDHFDYEEKIIMPELQKLLNDDELREIDYQSYRKMFPEQMIHMMQILFPHMNSDDRFTYLNDIKNCEPEKFVLAWKGIAPMIKSHERKELKKRLQIKKITQTYNEKVSLYYPWETKPHKDSKLMTDYHELR